MTTDQTSSPLDDVFDRMRPLHSTAASTLAERTYWAVEQGIVKPEDVPTVMRPLESIQAFAQWMKDAGVEDAWDAIRRPAACPTWCARDHDAMDHQARIGPGEWAMHTTQLARFEAPSGQDIGQQLELTSLEDYSTGLGLAEVNCDSVTMQSPEDLDALADALHTAAARWRKITA